MTQTRDTLAELEALAVKLGVEVRYEPFTGESTGPGGLCKVKGRWRVIINKRGSDADRLVTLARALGTFDLEPHFLSPQARGLVQRQRAAGKPEG